MRKFRCVRSRYATPASAKEKERSSATL
jgi:hypothetical protein